MSLWDMLSLGVWRMGLGWLGEILPPPPSLPPFWVVVVVVVVVIIIIVLEDRKSVNSFVCHKALFEKMGSTI